MESINEHKSIVDNLITLYQAEIVAFKKEVENMKGTYTAEYIAEYERKWSAKGDYSNTIKKSSEKTLTEVTHYSERIKKELDSYFDAMVRPEFANQINALMSTNMPLLDKEFERLAESAQSYMELRLVKNFAESRTEKQIKPVAYEDGSVVNEETIVKKPCFINIPNIDKVYADYNNFVAMAKQFATCYAGANCELKSFLDIGVSDYSVLSAMSFFRAKSFEKFEETMEKTNAILPENKIKKALSDADRKFIDVIINPDYPWLAEGKVKEIVKNGSDSELVNLLMLDERYSKYVIAAENEV